ncbi:MAG TPA: riboflavin biosynthesis protein RibF [Acidobacteriaceae bacterium]|jgi:riboflavin kinase/FMN adenylyltransferase|nr:riboflavin biosynthesis protein RibF [Acidobacteriaceae bacterium]
MKIYRSLQELRAPMPPTVAAIGNFDGVHRGHQEVIERVLERARGLGAQAIAVTFDPHPVTVLHPERAPKLITPMPQRLRLLAATGLDAAVVLPFTREFSMQTPREFAEGVLRDALHVLEVHEGDTFRFGHDAAAGIAELRELGRELGFGVVSHGALRVRGVLVSSSEVRRRIATGQMGMARALLGRPFSVVSTAAQGRGVGTKLTTPTINLAPYSELLPPNGVYVTRVRLGASALLDAVTNAGVRPTFDGAGFAVESHLLDGPPPVDVTETTPVEVCFFMRLREERRFPSPEALRAQIARDVTRAREYFRRASREQAGLRV